MNKGDISGPVKTQFGYHVIRLEDVEAPHVPDFEEVRAELEPQFRRDQAQTQFYEKSQQLADELSRRSASSTASPRSLA